MCIELLLLNLHLGPVNSVCHDKTYPRYSLRPLPTPPHEGKTSAVCRREGSSAVAEIPHAEWTENIAHHGQTGEESEHSNESQGKIEDSYRLHKTHPALECSLLEQPIRFT